MEKATSCIESMLSGKEPGKNVVIIGGGDTGIDYGVQLAKTGHNVFVIHHGKMIAKDSQMMHSYSTLEETIRGLDNMTIALGSVPTKINDDSVEYTVLETGEVLTVPADSVFYAVGLKPQHDAAMALMAAAGCETYEMGDCKRPSGLERVNRDALGAATRL